MAKSRRPYLIRAVYDWAADNGYTPHLLIAADAEGVAVPREYVKEGRITLNISPMAVQNLDLKRDPIRFFARFGGQPFEVQVPSGAVLAIFARKRAARLAPERIAIRIDLQQPAAACRREQVRGGEQAHAAAERTAEAARRQITHARGYLGACFAPWLGSLRSPALYLRETGPVAPRAVTAIDHCARRLCASAVR